MRRFSACILVLASGLLGCESENVTWAFVSNPSGSQISGGGAVIVITKTNTSPAMASGQRALITPGLQRGRPVTVHMATSSDLVAVERDLEVELRSPALADGHVVVPAGALRTPPQGAALFEVDVLDTGALHPSGFGAGRLIAATRGNVVVLEHRGGLVVFGNGPAPEVLPAGYVVDASGEYLRLLEFGQLVRELRGSAPAAPAQRIKRNAQRGSLRIIGPRGGVLAEVPESSVTLAGGVGGVFLHASFPNGLGESRRSFRIVTPTDNRYLLRVNAP